MPKSVKLSAPIALSPKLIFNAEIKREIHPNFADLFNRIKQIGHGDIMVKVADGVPVYIYKVTENIRLGGE